MENDDMDLVREFAAHRSEAAFNTLVTRYVNMVYSVAMRQFGDAHLAEEVAQATFLVLARKAASLGPKTILSAWLCRTAQFAAARASRTKSRRQNREHEAYMQSSQNHSETDSALWREIEPLLDTAMGELGKKDHAAIVLRYFEGKNFQEIGTTFGVSENAAKKRVGYALEKLRRYFFKRGVSSTAAMVAGLISANSIQAAPAGLAATISAFGAKGATATVAVASIVNGTLKALSPAKLKLAVGIAAGIILAAGVKTIFYPPYSADTTTDPVAEEILNRVFKTYAGLSSYSDNGKTYTAYATNSFSIILQRPDLYRMEWEIVGPGLGFDGAAWSAGNGDFLFFTGPTWKNADRLSRMRGLGEGFEFYGNISGGAALTIPPLFFGKSVTDKFGLLSLCRNFVKQRDAKVGNVECVVLTGHLKVARDIPVSLWIGKDDLLIHEIQRTTLDLDPTVTPRTPFQLLNSFLSAMERKPMVHTEVHEKIVVNQLLRTNAFVYPIFPDPR